MEVKLQREHMALLETQIKENLTVNRCEHQNHLHEIETLRQALTKTEECLKVAKAEPEQSREVEDL